MPYVTVNGVSLCYRIDGAEHAEHADAPWVVLSNALGADVSLWVPQIGALSTAFRVLRYDARGHGRSSAPAGPYTIEQLSGDVIALMDALAIERAHFCGMSMGGLTGIALAARHGERIDRLVLAHTAARIGSSDVWVARARQAREETPRALAQATLQRWLSPAFIAREPILHAAFRDVFAHTDSEGYAANCEAIDAADLRAELARIAAPTLVLAGTHDASTPDEQGRMLAGNIAGARYVELDAQHLSNVEQADAFTRAVLDFLRAPR